MTPETTFDVLPIEMMLQIFKKLPISDKKNARLVCRSWFYILNNPFAIKLTVPLNDYSIKTVKNCTQPHVHCLRVENCKTPIVMSNSRCTLLPTATKLLLSDGISPPNLIKFLRYYATDVKELEVKNGSLILDDESGWRDSMERLAWSFNWNSLKVLRISAIASRLHDILQFESEFRIHTKSIAEMFKVTSLPSLVHLCLVLDYGKIRNLYVRVKNPFELIYKHLLKFLVKHHETMKELELDLKGYKISPFQQSTRTSISPGNGNYKSVDVDLVQLERLTLNFNIDEIGPYILQILNGQRSLKFFQLNLHYWFFPTQLKFPILNELLPRNSSTLHSVHIYGILQELTWLPQCSKASAVSIVLINPRALIRLGHTCYLKNITKFSMVCYFGVPDSIEPGMTRQEILEWIVNNLPNVVELELLFRSHFLFQVGHLIRLLTNLVQLRTLRFLTPEALYCDLFCHITPGLSYHWVSKQTDLSEHVYQVQVNRPVFEQYQEEQRQQPIVLGQQQQ